jgi:hypothetical protein
MELGQAGDKMQHLVGDGGCSRDGLTTCITDAWEVPVFHTMAPNEDASRRPRTS